MQENPRVIIANITWNDSGWRNLYNNPMAGHRYARKYPGHESLNFEFEKKGLDDEQRVYGFVQWNNAPKKLAHDAVIIFYSKNLNTQEGEIVGIYGGVKILKETRKIVWKGFENDELYSNIVAKKNLSLLFPKPLRSSLFTDGKRLVPQAGFTYKPIDLAKKIIDSEIKELRKAGIKLNEYSKLMDIYRFITGNEYHINNIEIDTDQKEQEELLPIIRSRKSRDQIVKDLQEIKPGLSELVEFNGKQYKRDNKSIVELKLLRDFKCQICGLAIQKKDKTFYVEAAHITEKKHKGPETPNNILILCPNHHKEFDLGDKEIIRRTNEEICFDLNGRRHTIDLSIS